MEDKEKEILQNGKKRYTDLSYLNTIAKGNQDFILKMISTFTHEMSIDLPRIKQQLAEHYWEGVASTAHKIKPSFQFFGIKELQESILIIESNAKEQKNLNDLPELISKLEYICGIAIAELNQEKTK